MAAPKRSNNLLIVIGLVLLIAGAGLVIVLLRNNDTGATAGSGAQAGSDLVPVVVATRAISKGTTSKDLAAAVEVRQVAAVTRPSDAIVSLSELAEKITTVEIGAGQPLRVAFFKDRKLANVTVPAGKQGFAVTVPFTPAVAGYVGPGDKVNVFATAGAKGDQIVPACSATLCDNVAPGQPSSSSRLVLSAIEVLDVSQEVAANAGTTPDVTVAGTTSRPAAGGSITYLLAVDNAQAEKLVFFTTYTTLYLSLLPKDATVGTGTPRTQSNAFAA